MRDGRTDAANEVIASTDQVREKMRGHLLEAPDALLGPALRCCTRGLADSYSRNDQMLEVIMAAAAGGIMEEMARRASESINGGAA